MFQPSPLSVMDTFKGPPLPDNEEARVKTLQMLVPTTDDDPVLASLCKLVCSLLKVPAAGVLPGTPLSHSCAHADNSHSHTGWQPVNVHAGQGLCTCTSPSGCVTVSADPPDRSTCRRANSL